MAPRLASPLLAVLLVTSSSRGAALSFRYPRRPALEKRYSKVRYLVAAGDEHSQAHDGTGAAADGGDGAALDEDEMAEEFDAGSTLSEDLDVSSSSDSSFSDDGDAAAEEDEASDAEGVASSLRREDFDLASSSAGGTAATREAVATTAAHEHARRRQRAYQQYLGYECDLLASLLAPRRELCDQKFELVIDDLAFVGHPLCVDDDGNWGAEGTAATAAAGVDGQVDDIPRTGDVTKYSFGSTLDAPSGKSHSSAAPMTLFHFVLVLDLPDPSPDLPALDLTSWLQIFYESIAFKMTKALLHEELQCGYVTRECEKIGQLRERCMDDGQSYASFLTHAIHVSSLARSLQEVHTSIHSSSSAVVAINESTDVYLQLPPMLHEPARLMRLADIETPVDAYDPIFKRTDAAVKSRSDDELTFLPWKTLLLLQDQADPEVGGLRAGEEGAEVKAETEEDNGDAQASGEDIIARSRKVVKLLKPTLEGVPMLAEMAGLLGWSMQDDVLPVVRHLTHYRKARVVDVPRIQNYYAVSPLFDMVDLAKLATSWSIRFPTLAPLPSFLAALSSALKPFSNQLGRREQRQQCLDALIWLLQHDVVVQMHVRLRLVASEASKRRAAVLREQERERVREKRSRVAARKARGGGTDRASRLAIDEGGTAIFVNSAPALGRTSTLDSDDPERGRIRDRSTSPRETTNDEEEKPTLLSALSVTRPDAPAAASGGSGLALTPTTSNAQASGHVSSVTQDGELRFERRPVQRSRSPSRLMAMASGGGASNSTRGGGAGVGSGSSSGSRPATPRGRGRNWSGSRDAGTIGPSNLATDGLQTISNEPMRRSAIDSLQEVDISKPSTTANLAKAAHLQHMAGGSGVVAGLPSSVPAAPVTIAPALHGEGGAADMRVDRRSRSPSRARLRVTGFGGNEEVYVEGPVDNDEERQRATATTTGAEEESDAAAAPTQDTKTTVPHDEMRRLSLVGEDDRESDAQAKGHARDSAKRRAAAVEAIERVEEELSDRHERADDDMDGDDNLVEEEEIGVEAWEMQPVASVICEPGRASEAEKEWIAAMVEGRDGLQVEELYKLLPFLNGKHTVDEIVYRLDWPRKELRAVLAAFRDDILTFVHP